jgi:UDPglucose--hexose-1-phosphate uridylyltransferase
MDLKRDPRIKYVSLFKDYGPSAGQEFSHPTSQLTATMFVPRRVLYELRAGREYFVEQGAVRLLRHSHAGGAPGGARDRGPRRLCCHRALCSARPLRDLDSAPQSRGLVRTHGIVEAGTARESCRAAAPHAAAGAHVTEDFHLVLHTSPNSLHPSKTLGYWKTIDDDYHWHIEIMPVLATKARSYTFKEVYYSPVSSETAVRQLREAKIDG